MITISAANSLVTLINVFTVKPADQTRLHRSLDGTKVTMHAQWRSAEDYEAMREALAPLPYLREALTIAKFEPATYEVVETYIART